MKSPMNGAFRIEKLQIFLAKIKTTPPELRNAYDNSLTKFHYVAYLGYLRLKEDHQHNDGDEVCLFQNLIRDFFETLGILQKLGKFRHGKVSYEYYMEREELALKGVFQNHVNLYSGILMALV